MGTRSRIEWWTGERLNYECADELGLAEFEKRVRPRKVGDYLEYARRKQRRDENSVALYRLMKATGNTEVWLSWVQRVRCRARNRYWRAYGYPNLRKAWAARRANCARRRAIKELEAIRERQRRYLQQFGYERP